MAAVYAFRDEIIPPSLPEEIIEEVISNGSQIQEELTEQVVDNDAKKEDK